jgi:molecular chaperone Hsp33
LVAAHPDYDEAWFEALTTEQVAAMEQAEELGQLEKRVYRWHCGCNQARMLEVLAPVFRQDADGLFEGEEKIEIRCPRCAARHAITREALEAFVANGK